MFKKSFLALAIVSVLATGCSSGGSSDAVNSDGNMDTTPVAATPSKITGTVAKGIVIKGIVKAYALAANGTETLIGSGITDDKGFYSITIDDSYDNSQPIKIKLTPGTETTMLCDATAGCGTGVGPGEPVSIPEGSGFQLTAISASVADGATAKASVTPFTSMAETIVTKSGGDIDNAAVAAATSKIKNLLGGLDPSQIDPVDITNATDLSAANDEQQQYTVMLSALADQAFSDTSNDGVTLDDVIANLKTFNTDVEDDIPGNNGFNIVELYKDAVDIAEATDGISTETIAETKDDNAVGVLAEANNGEFPLISTTDENLDDIAKAKAFVTEVRTWATALQDLESPADVFLDEAKTISDTLGSNGKAVFEIAAQSIDAVIKEIDRSLDADETIAPSITLMDNGAAVGNIMLTDNSDDDANTTSIAMEATDLSGVAISGSIGVNSSLDATTFSAGDFTFNFSGTASNSSTKITLEDAAFTMTLAEDVVRGQDSNESPVDGMAVAGQLTAETLENGVATGDKIVANAEIKLVKLDENAGPSLKNDMDLNIEKIALNNLSVTNAAGSTSGLSVSLMMNNATSFDAVSFLSYEPVVNWGLSDDFEPSDINFDQTKEAFSLNTISYLQYYKYSYYANNTYTENYQTCAEGYAENGSFVQYSCLAGDAGNLIPQITPQYSDYNYVNTVTLQDFYFDGYRIYGSVELELDDMETAESFLDATLNITGRIDLADHANAVLSITANKTGFKDGTLTGTLAYDGKILSLNATTAGGEVENTDGSLSFSNADGVAMTVTETSDWKSGTVTVGNSEVGTIEDLNGALIMRYNDGTFESL